MKIFPHRLAQEDDLLDIMQEMFQPPSKLVDNREFMYSGILDESIYPDIAHANKDLNLQMEYTKLSQVLIRIRVLKDKALKFQSDIDNIPYIIINENLKMRVYFYNLSAIKLLKSQDQEWFPI